MSDSSTVGARRRCGAQRAIDGGAPRIADAFLAETKAIAEAVRTAGEDVAAPPTPPVA